MKLKVVQNFPGADDVDDFELDMDPNTVLTSKPKGPGKGHSDNLFTLSGKVLNPEGEEIGTTNFFDFVKMPLDKYDDLKLTIEEAQRIKQHVLKMKYGMSAFVPMICMGPKVCKFVTQCPIYKSLPEEEKLTRTDAYPIARQCIMEMLFVAAQLESYCRELDVSPDSPSELAMLSRLVELDTYEYRASITLSGGGPLGSNGQGSDLMLDQVIAINPEGEEIKQKVLHPLLELKFKIQTQRESILTALVGTRRERYKEKQALRGIVESHDTNADKQSELRAKIEEVKKNLGMKE